MRCIWCEIEAFRKQGHIWLCKKHYRFQQMRVSAKHNGKPVPSYEWLEDTWNALQGKCPICQREINWLSSDGTSTVITLQHDRCGNLRLLCLSCNTRHASFCGDSFYSADPTKRVCPRCRKELPFK